jgi:hypothetical protein
MLGRTGADALTRDQLLQHRKDCRRFPEGQQTGHRGKGERAADQGILDRSERGECHHYGGSPETISTGMHVDARHPANDADLILRNDLLEPSFLHLPRFGGRTGPEVLRLCRHLR